MGQGCPAKPGRVCMGPCVCDRGAMDGGAITWYISVYLMFIRVMVA